MKIFPLLYTAYVIKTHGERVLESRRQIDVKRYNRYKLQIVVT